MTVRILLNFIAQSDNWEGEVLSSCAAKLKLADAGMIRLKQSKADFEPFVSRAGRKLQHAVDNFPVLLHGIQNGVCIDVGASTGGFCDVLLKSNCSIVFAVDVGQSLLDWKIRSDPRVVVLENTNARYLNSSHIASSDVNVVTCDVSFISIKKALPPSLHLCSRRRNAVLCVLIKPQFECTRQEIGEGGIVREEGIRARVVQDITNWFTESFADWSIDGVIESPITGHRGNVEYLMVAKRGKEDLHPAALNSGGE